jgi:Tfp pilus assembly protein PilO
MSIKSELESRAVASQPTPAALDERATTLAELERRFDVFRAQVPRGTRIPDDLRTLVAAALEVGVSMTSLRRCSLPRSSTTPFSHLLTGSWGGFPGL